MYREAVSIKRKKTSSRKRKGRKKPGKVKSKKKKIIQKGKTSNSTSRSDEEPLNKGPYGFEHPDVVDVSRGLQRNNKNLNICPVDSASVPVSSM